MNNKRAFAYPDTRASTYHFRNLKLLDSLYQTARNFAKRIFTCQFYKKLIRILKKKNFHMMNKSEGEVEERKKLKFIVVCSGLSRCCFPLFSET